MRLTIILYIYSWFVHGLSKKQGNQNQFEKQSYEAGMQMMDINVIILTLYVGHCTEYWISRLYVYCVL